MGPPRLPVSPPSPPTRSHTSKGTCTGTYPLRLCPPRSPALSITTTATAATAFSSRPQLPACPTTKPSRADTSNSTVTHRNQLRLCRLCPPALSITKAATAATIFTGRPQLLAYQISAPTSAHFSNSTATCRCPLPFCLPSKRTALPRCTTVTATVTINLPSRQPQ